MGDLVQVRLCGFGGQGIVLAGTILGFAAIHDGKWVCGSNSYGAQARGGYARSEVVLSSGPVKFPLVIEPDILIALSQESYGEYVKDLSGTGGQLEADRGTRHGMRC
ncbi:MAG: 2-oxoacid:acceptor oxidoreductase family protein [Deltaproteobacteria bacterium]|nr:2-oxoacid:acceptor oxidoreductase family protein [Deltaproteobacteria bacterium]